MYYIYIHINVYITPLHKHPKQQREANLIDFDCFLMGAD